MLKKLRNSRKSLAITLIFTMLFTLVPLNMLTNPTKVSAAETTTWDFMNVAEEVTIQSTTGEYQGLLVDATSGKFYARTSGWAQFNAGTIISVPVDGPSVIVVNGYSADYTVNGEAAPADAAQTDVEYIYGGGAGYVDIVATANTYLGKISVTPSGEEQTSGSHVWNFRGTQDGAYDQTINGSVGQFDGLLIDATSGKLVPRNAEKLDSQINANTIISIPVGSASDYKLSINARGSMEWTVDGNALGLSDEAKQANAFAADGEYNFVYEGQTEEDQDYITLVAKTSAYMKELKIEWSKTPAPTQAGNGKIDIVDFGCEQFDTEVYNNLLTLDIANQLPVTDSKNILSFTINDLDGNPFLSFDAGNKVNHRYRADVEGLTVAYDSKNKKDEDGLIQHGHIYSNASASADVCMKFELLANDILTLYLGSNGNPADYIMVAPDGSETVIPFGNTAGVEKKVYYAPVDGTYKLYCSNEKLVVSRVLREHANPIKYSGEAVYVDPDNTGVEAPSGYSVVFTNVQTGVQTSAKVGGANTFSTYLYDGYDYKLSLGDANGYVIYEGDTITAVADFDRTCNIAIKPVAVKVATGRITGLEDKLANLTLDFISDEVYVPEIEIDGDGNFTLKFEAGIVYQIQESGVNDYTLETVEFSSDDDTEFDIQFTKKPLYDITLAYEGVEDVSNAVVTFTNVYEEGYSYTFSANEAMALRDGSYRVSVVGVGNYKVIQGVTPNVNVNGAAGSTTVKFDAIDSWDFSVLGSQVNIDTINEQKYFAGLVLNGNVQENKDIYLLMNADSTVTIPELKAGDVVEVKYCYSAAFNMPGLEAAIDEKSGSTSTIDSVSVVVENDGDFTISAVAGANATQTYLCAILVTSKDSAVEYREVLNVGADKEFKTINEALAEVRKMSREEGQEVDIIIEPGNYEEMLVIDTPYVNLINGSENPSIELKNKGVDIDENAVRITWYYGHGYTYYSMNNQCKYDEELLAANKSNGYASFKNPGSGTTNNSYWNASVIISASNVTATGIIFENSFNQYVSEKAAQDVIEAQPSNAKEGTVPRAELEAGSTKVQEKEYVERAAALAMYSGLEHIYFNNCKIISRQDTLYGGVDTTVAFEDCAIYGGTDYIFGGMVAVFRNCDLVFNTNDQTQSGIKNDVGYITAPQQSSGRGYLFLGCHVTSTTPGVDTASEHTSKPGDFGRPWAKNTSEAIFVNTTVDATDSYWVEQGHGASLIRPAGWNSSLSGEAPMYEYNTIELAEGVDNSAERVAWSYVLDTPVLPDGTEILTSAFLGDWYPFEDEYYGGILCGELNGVELLDILAMDDFVELSSDEKLALECGSVGNMDVVISPLDELSEEEALLLADYLKDYTILQAMDITLGVSTNYTATRNVTETLSPLMFVFSVTDDTLLDGRKFVMLKVHEGVASLEEVEVDEDGYILVDLNQFSTYVIAYENPSNEATDVTDTTETTENGEAAEVAAPSTGDTAPVIPFMIMMIGSVVAFVTFRKKKTA